MGESSSPSPQPARGEALFRREWRQSSLYTILTILHPQVTPQVVSCFPSSSPAHWEWLATSHTHLSR